MAERTGKSRGTPRHSIRIPDKDWDEAIAAARANEEDLSLVIRRYLKRYVQQTNTAQKKGR